MIVHYVPLKISADGAQNKTDVYQEEKLDLDAQLDLILVDLLKNGPLFQKIANHTSDHNQDFYMMDNQSLPEVSQPPLKKLDTLSTLNMPYQILMLTPITKWPHGISELKKLKMLIPPTESIWLVFTHNWKSIMVLMEEFTENIEDSKDQSEMLQEKPQEDLKMSPQFQQPLKLKWLKNSSLKPSKKPNKSTLKREDSALSID